MNTPADNLASFLTTLGDTAASRWLSSDAVNEQCDKWWREREEESETNVND